MTDNATPSTVIHLGQPPLTRLRKLIGRMGRSRNIVFGTVILAFMVFISVFASVLTTYDPILVVSENRLKPPGTPYLLGTDNFGRDMLTRILYGGRISLVVGIVSVALASVVGTLLGLVAGYYGGWLDSLTMRLIDVMLAFPSILLALVIIAVLGRSLSNVMLAVGIATVPTYTRIARASALSVKQLDYVAAAHVVGCPPSRIMFRHILPNVLAPIIVVTTTSVAGAIISGAALSFLGLGAQAPTPEWGLLLSEGRSFLRTAWWVTTFPGLAIMLTVMSINLIGDGLRDVLDPRLKL